jgi:hypothetical protein
MFKNKLIKYFVKSTLIAFFCIMLNNCTPGMSLYFKKLGIYLTGIYKNEIIAV